MTAPKLANAAAPAICREDGCNFHVGRPDPDYPDRCWCHRPDSADYYPVLITFTQTHVVWVAADSSAHAADMGDLYELTDDGTLAESGYDVKAPDKYDWHTIEHGDADPGMNCDAHITAHRSHLRQLERAACAEAGHPNAIDHEYLAGRRRCPSCYVVWDTAELVTL